MIIKNLELENIRSYINQSVSFSQGSTLLSGDIGSGKSTLLLAIEFVFFGLQRSDLEGVSLLRNGTSKGCVTCTFEHQNNIYSITRRLQRSKKTVVQGTGFFKKNDQLEELTASELSQRIIQLFEYPQLTQKTLSQIFRFTVYCPQEHMKEILLENPTQRLQTIRSIFGIDSYKIMKENATTLIRHSKEIIARLEGETKDIGELSHSIEVQQQKISDIIIAEEKLQTDLSVQQNNLTQLSLKKDILLKQKEDFLLQQQKRESLISQKKQSTEKLAQLIKQKELVEQKVQQKPIEVVFSSEAYDELVKEISVQTKFFYELERKKAIYDNDTSQLKKREQELSHQLQEYTNAQKKKTELLGEIKTLSQITSVADELTTIQKRCDILINKKSVIQSRVNDLRVSKLSFSFCPTCKQEVSEDHKNHVVKNQVREKDELEKMLTQLSVSLEHVETEKKDAQITQKKYDDTQQELIRLKTTLEYLDSHSEQQKVVQKEFETVVEKKKLLIEISLDELKLNKEKVRNLEEKQNELVEQKKRFDIYQNQKNSFALHEQEYRIITSQITQIQEDIQRTQKNIETQEKALISFDQSRLDTLTLTHTQTTQVVNELKEQMSAKRSQKEQLQEFISSQQNVLKKQQTSLDILAKTRTHQQWMKQAFVPLMDILEKTLLRNIQREFSQLFSQWFSLLIEDESMSTSLSEDFSPIIIQNGYEMQASHLSGGEKTSLALAYRLALNKVINTVHATIQTKDVLILDEPTDGFSTEQLDRVRIVLDTLGVKQLLIVSHEQKMHGFVDRIITIKKELNESFIQLE